MVTFYQVSDSGEMKKVNFSDLGDFALKDECHLDGLSKDTLNFDELVDKGIYTYSDFDGTEKEDGNYPSALTSGYVVVMVEDDLRAQRGITQMVLDDNNGSYYRRGILSETENVFEDWHSLSANNNSITNLSLGKGSPSAIDGIWTEVSNLSYNIQLWKQINGISTMSTTSETNVILNGIETLALTGAQTIYVRDSTGAFSKLCLDISNGGTGATTAAGALSALGAASQTDLNSLRDSVNDIPLVAYNGLSLYIGTYQGFPDFSTKTGRAYIGSAIYQDDIKKTVELQIEPGFLGVQYFIDGIPQQKEWVALTS